MSKHTPLPWEFSVFGREDNPYVLLLKGAWDASADHGNGGLAHCKYSAMSHEENVANAEFIVRAVNSHYELVDAVDRLQTLLCSKNFEYRASAMRRSIDALLAKAKGQPS